MLPAQHRRDVAQRRFHHSVALRRRWTTEIDSARRETALDAGARRAAAATRRQLARVRPGTARRQAHQSPTLCLSWGVKIFGAGGTLGGRPEAAPATALAPSRAEWFRCCRRRGGGPGGRGAEASCRAAPAVMPVPPLNHHGATNWPPRAPPMLHTTKTKRNWNRALYR